MVQVPIEYCTFGGSLVRAAHHTFARLHACIHLYIDIQYIFRHGCCTHVDLQYPEQMQQCQGKDVCHAKSYDINCKCVTFGIVGYAFIHGTFCIPFGVAHTWVIHFNFLGPRMGALG